MSSIKMFITAAALCLFSLTVYADEDQIIFNQIHLQASAEREVQNNEMQVVLVTEHQGKNPAELSEKVNQDMHWAISQSNKTSSIEVSTRSYQTYPVYRDKDIAGWRASQELQLKSEDMTRLSDLVGQLQGRLQVRQMQFSPTKQLRDRYENELIEAAMESFKQRVEIIKKHMDDKDYRIVDLHINTNGNQPPMMYAQRAMMQSMEMAAAPAVEAGTSTITVTVSGSVQFF